MSLRSFLDNHYWPYRIAYAIKFELPSIILGDKWMIKRKFRKSMGFSPEFKNPRTMAEKMQWIKLFDRHEINTLVADKYRVRNFYRQKFGDSHLVPLIKKLDSWKDVTKESLPNEPFVIKANTGSSTWQIVRDPKQVNIKELRTKCRIWTSCNRYYASQEWQYKNIKPCILIEKLLTDKNGKLPVDYKLHYIGGELQFIYCVIDREGEGYRAIFSPDWKYLPFQWVSVRNHMPIKDYINVSRPKNLDKMIEYGNEIAKFFKYYVRVDFYEVEDSLYFGEITLHHGSGMNRFYPATAECEYSNKLIIQEAWV